MPATRTSSPQHAMVERQLIARGIRDANVLRAMGEVPRDAFVPQELVEFAYEDTPLPIDESQTISQPYVVALMLEALELRAGDRVLDVGTGSGYAAAVASRVAADVYGIERHASLARAASERCQRLGYTNVHIKQGDGTLGWPEHAPFDAVMVAAGGPSVPSALKEQLAIGGRLVIPVGATPRVQNLRRIRRTAENNWQEDDLGPVAFVPLIGVAGWSPGETPTPVVPAAPPARPAPPNLPALIARHAEPFDDIDSADLEPLLDRVGEARVVCLGEASHGTAEFYLMRAALTRALIERKGFTIVALEADWPEAQRLDRYVRSTTVEPHPERAFDRFPTWMWANRQVMAFVDWVKEYNDQLTDSARHAGIYGLDLYSLHRSIGSVLRYLDDVDPEAARVARHRYGCLAPWQQDPAAYGAAVLSGRYEACEQAVVAMLGDMLRKRMQLSQHDPERLFDAVRNADLIAHAEEYYRVMYYGSAQSWNLRDQHMFETLEAVLRHRGTEGRAVVWAHNSHLGDAAWTEMSARGEYNIGQLVRSRFGEDAYLVGFGTDHGSVAAASDWDGPMEIKRVRPAHERSYERLCHESEVPAFLLPLRTGNAAIRRELGPERLERAIGVIYRPETELQSHYFHAMLPRQFDEWIWFDETHAVDPLPVSEREGMPQTYPFAV
ncbi:MAG TPA: protein-L-isoaspartate(D-aspartate) O-methyltransferase [Gemmatimonadales bacterium]|nr:protein-L-isoaspartate(D-aspartate) O-methyltransferase [Gemmatimonadales bacterium]